MYRVLVADDEPYIADGVSELLYQQDEFDVEVMTAYSGEDAMEAARERRVDICIADIRMPGLNGIELHAGLQRIHPHCKTILLSGHKDFEYAQKALQTGVVDYLVKRPGDDRLIASFRRAIQLLEADYRAQVRLDQAEKEVESLKDIVRDEMLRSLVLGDAAIGDITNARVEGLHLPLRWDADVALVIGKVERHSSDRAGPISSRTLQGVISVVTSYLREFVVGTVVLIPRMFVVLLQEPGNERPTSTSRRSDVADRCSELLAPIQKQVRASHQFTVSFAYTSRSTAWSEVPGTIRILRALFSRPYGDGREMILSEEGLAQSQSDTSVSPRDRDNRHAQQRDRLDQLATALEHGDKELCAVAWSSFSAQARSTDESPLYRLQCYYEACLVVLRVLNTVGYLASPRTDLAIGSLFRAEELESWDDSEARLTRWFEHLIDAAAERRRDRTKDLVVRLNEHITNHLSGNLSLVKLAEHVNLNPDYLSRLYKQISGRALSAYVSEVRLRHASELLVGTRLKIQEIANSCGFDSPGYFARCFKKHFQMTPQEYRETKLVAKLP